MHQARNIYATTMEIWDVWGAEFFEQKFHTGQCKLKLQHLDCSRLSKNYEKFFSYSWLREVGGDILNVEEKANWHWF